jgi:hypothetical protein
MRIDDLIKELESLRLSLGDDTEVFYQMDSQASCMDKEITGVKWEWKVRPLGRDQSYNAKVVILE